MIRSLLSLLTVAALVMLAPQAEAILIAHYEFESPSNLGLDSAGGDNNGVQQGADSAHSMLSRLGTGALMLDGTGTGLRLDNPQDFQNLTTFTIAAFVRPDLNNVAWGGTNQQVGRVFGSLGVDGLGGTPFGDGNGYGFGLLRGGTGAGFRYTTYGVQDYDVSAASLDNPFQDDQWAHVAVVVTEGNAEFFMNGISVTTIAGANANPTTNPFHIGASATNDTDPFAGLIDDLRVYNEALDATAIANLANPAGSGQRGLVFTVDRELGSITLTNDSAQSAQLRGYSLFSKASRLDASAWTPISGGALDPGGEWLEFSGVATDLSEGTQEHVTLTPGQSVALGNVWRRGPEETSDLTAEALLANGMVTPVLVEFTGNGGQSYLLGDLNFDNSVDLDDFNIYIAGMFSENLDPETSDPYLLGDLDGDLDNDAFDFLAFKNAFVAQGGNPAALIVSTAVPEPATFGLVFLATGFVLLGRSRCRGRHVVAALLATAWLAAPASAQFTPVFEYSFPASYDSSVLILTDLSPTGNNGTLDPRTELPPLVDDRPAGFDPSLMSITGASGGHGRTDATNLLQNSIIDDHGGFMMDVWMKWEGVYTNVRKQIDYAGTEFIRTANSNVEFALSNGATVLRHPIVANQWYHVQGVFHSGSNQTDVVGNLVGDAFLYVDGVLVDSALGVTKTSFGDSLNRPIGINRWAGGGGDWNQGWIFNPGVYLGKAEEPMSLQVDTTTGEVQIVHLASSLLPDDRNIDFYQISSQSGALDSHSWESLEASQFDIIASGDYNADGAVDLADYTVWRNSLGDSGEGLPADGNNDGVIDSDDYSIWKGNFGANQGGLAWVEAGQVSDSLIGETFLTGSSLFDNGRSVSLGQLWDNGSSADPTTDLVFQYHVVGESGLRTGVINLVAGGALTTSPVPEPATVGLLALCGALLVVRRRTWRRPALAIGSLVALIGLASPSDAVVTNDRLYPMGEAAGDGGANGVYVVDTVAQATFDDEYDGGDISGTAHDLIAWEYNGAEATLAPSGAGPQYVNVVGRPLAGGGTQIGIRFDGVNDLLIGARLGLPQTSASSQMSASTPPTSGNVGPFDYHGVTRRGFQLWVNPDESNPVFGTAQQAVVLDTNQHGVLISSTGTWLLRYDGVTIDSGVQVKNDSVDNGWSHVMVVNPDRGPYSGGGQLFIDGVAVAARNGGYVATDDSPLVIGANTGTFNPNATPPAPLFTGGNTDFFAGVVDQMSMFVLGKNVSGQDFGTFNLLEHNEFVAHALAGYSAGDLTGDGQVNESDVSAFIAGWGTTNLVNNIPVGDLNSRLAGDFNLDGLVDLADWQVLVENYSGAGALDLPTLLAGRAVPEPSAVVLLLAAAMALPLVRTFRSH